MQKQQNESQLNLREQQSPPELIKEDLIVQKPQSFTSGNSNQKIPQIDMRQQQFSPLKQQKNKQTTSLQKKANKHHSSQFFMSLKKAQSVSQKHTGAKASEKSIRQGSIKSFKSTSSFELTKRMSIRGVDIQLLLGEEAISKQECLMVVDADTRKSGHILVTNYRIMFIQNNKHVLNLPLGYVLIIDRQVQQKQVVWSRLQITTKFGRTYRFRFITQPQISNSIFRLIKRYTSNDFNLIFAFTHAKHTKIQTQGESDLANTSSQELQLNIEKQYQRMGITTQENSLFKKVDNSQGKLTMSYPPWFIVTKRVKEETLLKCLKIRTKQRVPILSYFHYQQKNKKNSCLWRAAQCKHSSLNNRSFADEEYVKCLALQQNKQKSQMLLVYDIKVKAGNQSIFYENSFVKNITDLLSPLLMRQSFTKMSNICQNSATSKWVGLMEDSKWYEQIWKLLKYAEQIAQKMKNGNPILIQCIDGTDRSAQLSTLVQIILCPYYRTFQGFKTLVQKQFMWIGYPFASRLRSIDEERIPTLIQLMDCIHQLIVFFPLSFQYTSKYLARLVDSLYNNKYGNFLCNNHHQFLRKNICNLTLSFWQTKHSQIQKNAYFEDSMIPLVHLVPIRPIGFIRVWHDYFLCLDGVKEKEDKYKINPDAEENMDYVILEHLNSKHENSQFKLLLQQQVQKIQQLKEQINII